MNAQTGASGIFANGATAMKIATDTSTTAKARWRARRPAGSVDRKIRWSSVNPRAMTPSGEKGKKFASGALGAWRALGRSGRDAHGRGRPRGVVKPLSPRPAVSASCRALTDASVLLGRHTKQLLRQPVRQTRLKGSGFVSRPKGCSPCLYRVVRRSSSYCFTGLSFRFPEGGSSSEGKPSSRGPDPTKAVLGTIRRKFELFAANQVTGHGRVLDTSNQR